jgi:hypothetical protein
MVSSQTGEVVFYNGKYGFVRLADETSVFFADSQLDGTSRQQLRLLDTVSFQLDTVNQGPHQGKLRAVKVRRLAAGDPGRYRRVVGQVQPGSKQFKRLISPQLSKPVLLHFNRLLDRHVQPKHDELLVFYPVISSENANELFAFFAYPLSQEKELDFLREQLEASQLPGIQIRIDQVLAATRTAPVNERFAAALRRLGPVRNLPAYQQLTELLKEYAEQNYRPAIAELQAVVAPEYQLMLWENRLVPDYVPALMLDYFLRTSADRKRALAARLVGEERRALLTGWVRHLLLPGKITRLHNGLKTGLDVMFRNPETKDPELYRQLYDALDLTAQDWQQLHQQGYVHQVLVSPESTALPPRREWLSRAGAARVLAAGKDSELLACYEAELLDAEPTTEEGQLRLALAAKLLVELMPAQAERILVWYWPRFTALQRLVLWLVEVGPDIPEVAELYAIYEAQLAVFLRLRYYLRQTDATPEATELTAEAFGAFAATHYANRLVDLVAPQPGPYPPEAYYTLLSEVHAVHRRWPEQTPSVEEVAASLYKALPLYQVEHIRLYLQHLVGEEVADFIGFREPFRLLTREEKQDLRARFDSRQKPQVWEQLRQGIVPCEEGEAVNDQMCYTAYLENIYFGRGSMQLRLPDGEFTAVFTGDAQLAEKASVGINSLPVESSYNRIPIKIWVKEQDIVFVTGLVELFDLLLEEEIAFTFRKKLPDPTGPARTDTDAYAEDWELRRQVLAYLQQASVEVREVGEPKNYGRRLDSKSGIDEHEKTVLYVLPTDDGVGIVWENIDFSDDRATYVFKASQAELPGQLDKLEQAIATYAQWRSALANAQNTPAQISFRNRYGYLGRIRKQRGRNQPFEAWHERLLFLLQQPVPPVPDEQEWAQAWAAARSAPPIQSTTRPIKRRPSPVVLIDESSLDRVNPDTLVRQPASATPPPVVAETGNLSLLRFLQQFNQHFCAGLPI